MHLLHGCGFSGQVGEKPAGKMRIFKYLGPPGENGFFRSGRVVSNLPEN